VDLVVSWVDPSICSCAQAVLVVCQESWRVTRRTVSNVEKWPVHASTLINLKHWCDNFFYTEYKRSKMPPEVSQSRRTQSRLLVSKLLDSRDSASPFTLIIDSLEQSARPLWQEYIRRAKVSAAIDVNVTCLKHWISRQKCKVTF